jgi:hypothetical protein
LNLELQTNANFANFPGSINLEPNGISNGIWMILTWHTKYRLYIKGLFKAYQANQMVSKRYFRGVVVFSRLIKWYITCIYLQGIL